MLVCLATSFFTSVYAGTFETGKKLYDQNKFSQAYPYLKKAAYDGNPKAAYALGYMYQHGYGVKKDNQKAFLFFLEAARQGNSKGEFGLGYMYEHGLFVQKDNIKARIWYEHSARQGNSMAQANFGSMLAEAGGEKNEKLAFEWNMKSALQGNEIGQHNIPYFYEKGLGTKKDLNEARKWYA